MSITCGVPQGSVLGPLLFIIYVNDLSSCLDNTHAIQFADDTTVYIRGNNIPSLYVRMNADLCELTDWFYSNKLSLNVSKTNYMLFTKSRSIYSNEENLKMANIVINRTPCFKLLGVHIDEQLSWNHHIKYCHSKLRSAHYAFNKVKYVVPSDCLRMLYYSLVYPHLTYGIILWGSTYDTYIHKLFVAQKKIIRSMSRATYYEHCHPLFCNLKLLKLEDIYQLEVCKFMFKYVNNALPKQLCNIFKRTSVIHAYGTRQTTHLRSYKARTNVVTNSILCNGPVMWNKLHNHSKTLPHIRNFTSATRRDILLRYRRSVDT